MTTRSSPWQSGTYRIKVFTKDLYIESIPQKETQAYTPWMRLASPTKDNKQKWLITQSSSNTWTIVSTVDNAGLIYKKTSQTYRGHGYPYPGGQSIQWKILDYGQYSKISAPVNGSDVFDSQYPEDNAVHFWQPLDQFAAPHQCFIFELVEDEDLKLDVVFLQDATGSQQPYINAARDQISQICIKLKQAGKFRLDSDLRFRLISFRDHPPQDTSYIINENDFTSDVSVLQAQLVRLFASGGGDGPEAQADALDAALNSAWRTDAAKVVVLITDSPPHGVEDDGDGFPDGSPNQLDPARTVSIFADRGITFNVIACEPTLSNYYDKALDFYRGLVAKTPGGQIIPLGNTDAIKLQEAIIGLVAHSLDNARLASKYGSKIRDLAQAKRSLTDIIADIFSELKQLGVQTHQVAPSDNVYLPNEQGEKNVKIWEKASSLKDAKDVVRPTTGDRINPEQVLSDAFGVTYKQAAITSQDVNAIVLMALKAAGIAPPIATMFLSWIKTTVSSIVEALWKIGWSDQAPNQTTPQPDTAPSLPQTVKPNETKKSSVWALVIGVNEYTELTPLTGCVADADDFLNFLTAQMGVPNDHIKNLRNKDATRQAIISSIADLAKDNRIENGDAIVIYYAGHGAQARPPKSWDAGGGLDARVQMICAYDFVKAKNDNEDGQGILDITLGALLSQLAKAKGDNITVILDSCYSGSGTRKDRPVPNIRGVELPDDYEILDTVDQELLRILPDQQRKVIIAKDFEKSGSASHVLLAGCSSKQTSKEDPVGHRGYFTQALMKLLRASDLNTITYKDAISRMDDLTDQTPQCDGVNSSRIMFDGKAVDAGRILYCVTLENSVITLQAGEAQGITKDAKFNVLDGPNIDARILGSITADKPSACSTTMKGNVTFTSPAYAVQTSVGDGMDIAIGLPVDDAILPVLRRVVQEMKERRPEKRNLRPVDMKTPPEYEIAVHNDNGKAMFELTDKVWVQEKLKYLSPRIPLTDTDYLYKVFSSAADFFYNLRRSSKAQEAGRQTDISENVSVEVYELKMGNVPDVPYPVALPKLVDGKPDNLNRDGVVRIDVEEGRTIKYGLKLSSRLDQPLYVWGFAFNLSDLSIVEIYRPPSAKQSDQADPSIPTYGDLSIGYGAGGARPLEIDDSEDVDVSYFKFFITTEYVDLSKIKQDSPFDPDRKVVVGSSTRKLFDTLLVALVSKKIPL
ncbi:hypothetical protein GYMLUDRAFT_36230 [Collybiopsis luxurians FD-317 M1]|nr:hypothetical protein GYMLUDRAFT_36230 [Collybiopsis luxurians FD-317 M1]